MTTLMRLFQHKNGYWHAELDRDMRRSLRTRDKAEAKKLFRRLKSEFLLNKVTYLEGRKPAPTLEDFTAEYLDWIYQGLAYNTYSQARSGFKALAIHIPGDTRLDQITRRQIDLMQGSMTGTAKASTVNTRFRNYHAAFNKAVEWGYLKHNPFTKLKALKEQEVFPRYLTHAEIEAILGAERHPRYLALWQFLLLTGCRRSEAMALTWADIDLAAGRITIKQTKNRRPKIVFISPQLQEVLGDLGPGVGKLWTWCLRQVTRRFQVLARSLGIQARLHDLRHSYCSYAVMSGIDLYTVGKLAGHRDIKSTQRYAHLSPSHMEEAQAKLANALNLRQVNPKR